ncbi:MAG: PIN domain-containing protein [Pyrinomonadaceae bacterium]
MFLDSAYAIALSSPKDEYHERAVILADQIEAEGAQLITTRAVILEIGDALSSSSYRKAAIQLLASIENDPNFVEVVPMSEELYEQGFKLYRSRPDKEWGITDCISFVVMQSTNLIEALTTDRHFQQAGFQALLREV